MADSRSRSPRPERRRRSRSPDYDRSRRPRNQGGFRWKGKRPRDDRNRDDDRRLERGYRERYRPQSPRRDRSRDRYGERDRGRDTTAPARHDDKDEKQDGNEPKPAPKKPPVAAAPGEEMIIVHVNDRLGTKAAIPCLASDPIKLFKAQVAARIGREPHEILLKRQGERPFKDQLTLQDYGVSNGVQLDLEVDTGD
ncbi:ubiquitin-like protein (HubA), putative [Talaromyces stipitatus ATCC 10500]|uniref:Ubiquitin-like modifier HUB1 n=1 Tax=Talaromyces stipitatus (strain ATCC 10500 / CBS 375.48 / QM 6759 / NRRL 1006) TaxID=441959 RepID=B8M6L5_TALSN|nr:ubiquitin-like protein (HubA), putative [Talaromyces stipitatus ATCC 10500]EED19477.1 ubiquitin-like protein (HubA), putative [Talaromyces stipitatus ATCC 10500]